MTNKDALLSLVEKMKQVTISQDIYQRYIKFRKDISQLLTDYTKILTMNISEYDEFLTEIDKQSLEIIRLLISSDLILDENEIKRNIERIKNSHNNQELENLIFEYQKIEKVQHILEEESISNNIENILAFLEACYHKGLISLNDAIRLNLYLTYHKEKVETLDNNQIDEKPQDEKLKEEKPQQENKPEEPTQEAKGNKKHVIVIKNSSKIDYSKLFIDRGYDYNNIGPRSTNKLELYGKEDNAIYVLNFLNKYLTNEDKAKLFPTYSKLVVNLIVYFDKETIDKLSNFLDNNDVSILEIMTRGSMFFGENIDYIIKDENGNIIPSQYQTPSGDFDSIMEYAEGYKTVNGIDERTKLTNKEMKGILQFFKVPIKEFTRNLQLVKKYGLVGTKLESKDESFLNGKNTEYILDRCIELGIEDYIKKVPSFLNGNGFAFRFYKIKRALSLGTQIYVKGGLRKELTDDNIDFDGISWKISGSDRIITQRITNYDQDEYKKYYEYHKYTPASIFHYNNPDSQLAAKIEELFKNDYANPITDEKNIHHSEIIDMLDNWYTDTGLLKKDNNTYCFYITPKPGFEEKTVLISRHKVIRLCNLLKDIKIDFDSDEALSILMSIIMKDSILSKQEYNIIKILTQKIINAYKYRGVTRRRKNQ